MSEMAFVPRHFYLLHHLQTILENSAPSSQTFLKYRTEIVTEGGSKELKALLNNENQLSEERNSLLLLIHQVKGNQKKKAFACSTQKLVVVKKKLKEITKQLNHKLMECNYVNLNLDKIIDVLNWIKQRIENDVYLVLSNANDPTILDTTIQKKEKMIKFEFHLAKEAEAILKEEEKIKNEENILEILKKRIEVAKKDLQVFQDRTDPNLMRKYRDIQVEKESTQRFYKYEQNKIKDETGEYGTRV